MSTMPQADATPDGVWRQVERRLALLDGFGLLVVFVRDQPSAASLKQRVVAWLGDSALLADVSIADPESFAARALAELFSKIEGAKVRLCWVEAYRGAGIELWDAGRAELLNRLNERRGRLEAALHGPLILLLPEGAQRLMSSLAPDLWHVRSLSLDLEGRSGVPIPDIDAAGVNPAKLPTEGGRMDAPAARGAWLDRWTAAFGERHPVEIDVQNPAVLGLRVVEGAAEARRAVRQGDLATAMGIAETLVQLASARMLSGGGLRSIAAADDQALAYRTLGEVWAAFGWTLDALENYQAALDAARAAAQLRGDTPGARVLVSIALDAVRDCASWAGEWERAFAAGRESLELRERNVLEQGRQADPLYGLALSQLGLGTVCMQQGDVVGAQRWLTQALLVIRETVLVSSEAAQPVVAQDMILRALAVVCLDQGDESQAAALLGESLTFALRLASREGQSLEAQEAWLTGLHATAVLLLRQGDAASAAKAAHKAVQLSSSYVVQAEHSRASLLLRWDSLTLAAIIAPSTEVDAQKAAFRSEWAERTLGTPLPSSAFEQLSQGDAASAPSVSPLPSSAP